MAYGCRITWTANPEPNIVGYRVYCGAASGVYDAAGSPKTVGRVTYSAFNVPALGPWFLAIAAVDDTGKESGLSMEVAVEAETLTAPVGAFGEFAVR
jgi:hypothetical protein